MALLIRLWQGNCLDHLRDLPDASVDAFVGDPPYDLCFMAKEWDDNDVLRNDKIWRECLRTLIPGGILKQFSAPRTYHRLCKTLETVGFLDVKLHAWVHGQGFPKGKNISAAIDKMLGVEREIVGYKRGVEGENLNDIVHGRKVRQTTDQGGKGAKQVAVDVPITVPTTELAKLWQGYNVALKPAWEPVVVARKFDAG
jgi:site-specific DNA-methyltransferase (adenine-specific)